MGSFKDFYLKERRENKEYDYASSQFDLPLDISQQIYNWGVQNIHENALTDDGRQDVNDTHLTILFGLNTSYSEDVEQVARCFSPFGIKLGKINLFKQDDKDVVKIDVEKTDYLMKLNQFFKTNLKHFESHPEYSPHITICYAKPGQADHLVGSSVFEGLEILVEGISYSSKRGEKTYIEFQPETYSPPIGIFDVRYRS
jgi:2'-5' RNA ligase